MKEGSKISSQTPDEPLIPEQSVPSLQLPEFTGVLPGIGIVAISVVVAWVLREFLPAPALSALDRGIVPDDFALRTTLSAANFVLAAVVPVLVSVVMLWVAFVKVEIRDRYLWSAIMIVSAQQFAGLLNFILPDVHDRFGFGERVVYISNTMLVTAAVSYAALYFALTKGMQRPKLGSIAVISTIVVFALPVALGFVSWATALCSLLSATGIWSIGAGIARRVGFDVYAPDSEAEIAE